MRQAAVLMVLCALAVLAVPARGAEFEEKWLYASPRIGDDQRTEEFIELLKTAKQSGVTHVLMGDSTALRPESVTPEYLARVAKVKAALAELGIKNAMNVYPTGWGGRYFGIEPGLAAGVPARKVPFVVKGDTAMPDPSTVPAVANAAFDAVTDGKPAGWTVEGPENLVNADTEDKHGGTASVRFGPLDGLDQGNVRVKQTLAVTPFQYYRMSFWVKSDNVAAEGEDYVLILAPDRKRRYCYEGFRLRAEQDWTLYTLTFNTLEATELEFSVGASAATAGTLWMDDIAIEPAGMLGVLRGPTKPLEITSADGKTVYEEGRDYAEIAMAQGGGRGRRGQTEVRPIPGIGIPEGSRIKDGETILATYFHTARIYFGQVNASLEDPRYVEFMEREVKGVQGVWEPHGFFMGYDEIRVGGWEIQPDGTTKTPGQMLAENTRKGIEIIRKNAPQAVIYTWSDMYTPLHNARPFSTRNAYYYLVNGNWDGAWEGLPSDVVVMNWYAPTKDSVKWFADRGNKQVLCGYYDTDDLKANIKQWMEVSEGSPGVIGMMYTTWRRNFGPVAEFFQLVKDYPAWVEETETGESGVNEK